MKKVLLASFIIGFFTVWMPAASAEVFRDNFDSYTNGADLEDVSDWDVTGGYEDIKITQIRSTSNEEFAEKTSQQESH